MVPLRTSGGTDTSSFRMLLIDKYHAIFSQTGYSDYMRLGHLSEPDQPIYNTTAPDLDLPSIWN